MKKRLAAVLAMVVLLSLCSMFVGCSDGRTPLYVFNCGDYIGEDVIAKFEEEYPNIRVYYETFDNPEAMYQKYTGSNIAYDVLIPSDYMIERLIKEEELVKLDTSRITNYSQIDENLLGREFDPNAEYSVPYMWGTLGIVYNTKKVTEPVDSWGILWDEKYKNEILMLDSLRDTMGAALKYLGYSMNTSSEAEINAARDALIQQKPLVAQYGMDTLKGMVISNQYAMTMAYSGDACYMMSKNPDLQYVVPKEGSNVWVDAMVISKRGKNLDGAYLFIDFMCRTDIARENAEYIEYSTPHKGALAEMDESFRNNPVYNPPADVIARCETFRDLGAAQSIYNDAYKRVGLS